MTGPKNSRGVAVLGSLRDGWTAFWFTPTPAYALGLVRIALGALMIYVTLDLLPVTPLLFSTAGPVPVQPTADGFAWIHDYQFGIFEIWTGDTSVLVAWVALLLSAISLTVGWHSRISAVMVWVIFLSFIRRNPGLFNAGDHVMTNTTLILAISACGAALSLDQRRRTGRFWSAETLPQWPIRLLQVQLSVIYFFNAQTKLIGNAWDDGSAVSFPLRTYRDWAILPVPQWAAAQPLLVNIATWGTVAIELSLAILVWNKRLRYWVLAAGVFLHFVIWLNLPVVFFSLAMVVLYLAWVPWKTARDLPVLATNALNRIRRQPSQPVEVESSSQAARNDLESERPRSDSDT